MEKRYLICIFIIASSCTNVLEIDRALEKPKLVVNAFFTTDSTWVVRLTRSRDILDNSPGSFELVEDAKVVILDQHNTVVETLVPGYANSFRFQYRGDTKPVVGEQYAITIQTDTDVIQAVSAIPPPVEIKSVKVDSSRFNSTGSDIEVSIMFDDPVVRKNFYAIKILRSAFQVYNNDTTRFREDVHFDPIDPALKDNLSNGAMTLFDDNLFNGKTHLFRLTLRPQFSIGNTENLKVVLLTVSEEYYHYFVTRHLQDNKREDPFAQPTQVFSNVKNGLGIFAGYSSFTYDLK